MSLTKEERRKADSATLKAIGKLKQLKNNLPMISVKNARMIEDTIILLERPHQKVSNTKLTCIWHEEDDDWSDCSHTWSSTCGMSWVFPEYRTPYLDGMIFCPKCGRVLEEYTLEQFKKDKEE